MLFLGRMLSALLGVNEQRVILGDSECVLGRVPRAHLDLLVHVDLGRVLLLRRGSITCRIVRDNLLALISPIVAHIFASFVHEFHVDLAVRLIFDIDDVNIGIITAGEHHVAAWRNLQVKLVEDVLALINFAQLLLQIVRHVEHFARLALVSNVPDLNAKVVARIDVSVVDGRELGTRY